MVITSFVGRFTQFCAIHTTSVGSSTKKETYPGEHTAIVVQQISDKVQALLNSNIQGERRKARATKESLFTGILFDTAGTRYTPTHASKSGRRYRYYTSQSAIKKTGQSDAPVRIPAPDIEKAVVDRLLEWFEKPEQLFAAIHDETLRNVAVGRIF